MRLTWAAVGGKSVLSDTLRSQYTASAQSRQPGDDPFGIEELGVSGAVERNPGLSSVFHRLQPKIIVPSDDNFLL